VEADDNSGGIVFAKSAKQARRRGACEFGDGEPEHVIAYRAKWADWCAPSGIVHASLMIEYGWHFECHGCANRIDLDWLAENNLSTEDVIGTQGSVVYCCAHCKAADERVEAEKKRVGEAFLETMRAVVRQRFGDVNFHDVDDDFKPSAYILPQDGAYGIGSATIHFDFPGMAIAPATIEFRWPYSFRWDGIGPVKLVYRCCAGDQKAFEQFADQTKGATQHAA
jgi:hypothetical protein